MNKNGLDIFFEESSLFDPVDLEIFALLEDGSLSDYRFNYNADGPFEIRGFRVGINESKIFILEYGNERTDTLIFSSSALVNENPNGNRFDVSFNGDEICTDCNSNETYELQIND